MLDLRARAHPADWNFHHREETVRGLDDGSDLYAPGTFGVRLRAGESATLVLSTEPRVDLDSVGALDVEGRRQRALLEHAGAIGAHPVVQQLVLAADQFIVERRTGQQSGKTIIAGYHWFNDWGRDTMISLPGLALSTGRISDAADILRTFARYVDQGLLPNNFPDQTGVVPGYNTADATLWYVLAIAAYEHVTGDGAFVDELLPVLRSIVDWHIRGTRFGIGMDSADGLLHAGEAGLQLTWMDANIGDWVVTPRIGKPVELQALWYNVLRHVAAWWDARAKPGATELAALAERTRTNSRARFVRPSTGSLADVVDAPDGDDLTLRPNQIFALSLPFPLLEGRAAAAVVEAVGRALLTPLGLRSLAAEDSRYPGQHGGGPSRRDAAYHQGPVWSWLIGAYSEAHWCIHGDRAAALELLRPFEHHLRDACVGSVSEILEGDPPHLPRGAVAQAWGVAEVLRVWRNLAAEHGYGSQ